VTESLALPPEAYGARDVPLLFHVHDGKDCPDHDGVELASLGEVRAQAVIACGEALKDLDGAFWESREWRMQVVDERGATVCVLTLSGAC
jgi:hypothetical protein